MSLPALERSNLKELREILAGGHAANREGKIMSNGDGKTATAKPFLEALFVVWVIVVNLLYYMQYKNLMVARFGHLLHRWR